MHPGRTWRGEFIPALAPGLFERQVISFQCRQRERIHATGWMAACTEGAKAASSQMVEQRLGHDAARGIPGAKKEDVVSHHEP